MLHIPITFILPLFLMLGNASISQSYIHTYNHFPNQSNYAMHVFSQLSQPEINTAEKVAPQKIAKWRIGTLNVFDSIRNKLFTSEIRLIDKTFCLLLSFTKIDTNISLSPDTTKSPATKNTCIIHEAKDKSISCF